MRGWTRRTAVTSLALGSLWVGCRERRELPADPLTFEVVRPLLLERCARCHGEAQRSAGVALATYYEAIGCTTEGVPVAHPASPDAPIIAVLARPAHAVLLSPSERALLLRWVEAGAPGGGGRVHGPDILDPRGPGWHGKLASEQGLVALRDPAAAWSCGRCHEGAPVRPQGVTSGVPDAPSCTSCHQQPGGVFACATCHGATDRGYPPRDRCYFRAPARGDEPDAHRAHVTGTRVRSPAFDCATCHPVPGEAVLAGSHANGALDLAFAPLAGASARYDSGRATCAVACHARGGEHPEPSWREQLALDCNACHLSPPRDHYPGACSTCHAQMGQAAGELLQGTLHLNGAVDLGSGDGTCGACHGEGGDPWPRDDVHRAHRDTQLTVAVACDACHSVPGVVPAPGHLDGRVQVSFGPRARHDGGEPTFDPVGKRCSAIACHAGPLQAGTPEPRWSAPSAAPCTGCHGTPPPPPHVEQSACGGGLCHGAQVAGGAPGLGITPTGRRRHIDGTIQTGD